MFANGFTAETRADRSSLDLPGTAVRAKALGSARRGGRSAAVLNRRRAVGNLLEPSSALRRWDRGGGDREHAELAVGEREHAAVCTGHVENWSDKGSILSQCGSVTKGVRDGHQT